MQLKVDKYLLKFSTDEAKNKRICEINGSITSISANKTHQMQKDHTKNAL